MILNVYAIRDSKIHAFSQPYYSHTHGSALRAFSDHVNDANTQPNKHPEDYTLWHLGTFNDETGDLNQDKPTQIGTASEYRKEN